VTLLRRVLPVLGVLVGMSAAFFAAAAAYALIEDRRYTGRW